MKLDRRSKNIVGQRFGRLIVQKFLYYRKSSKTSNTSVWECLCDCGNIKQVPLYSLRNKHVQSCGCLQKESRYNKDAGVNTLIRWYKVGARVRKITWELTKEQVKDIIFNNCFYCNKPPSRYVMAGHNKSVNDIVSNGIDRLDNSKGYNKDNCVPCCTSCNTIKSSLSVKNMINILNIIGYQVSDCSI